jgi:hypothetical protein
MAQSGHADRTYECPLLGVKRTSVGHAVLSAFDPKRPFGLLRPKGTVARQVGLFDGGYFKKWRFRSIYGGN